MKPTTSLKRGLEQVRREWRAGRYARALAEVERLQQGWPDNPNLLRLWAELVQLQEDTPHTLEAVRQALERAVELDSESPAAAVELGHFLSNVEDDATAADQSFEKAAVESRRLLIEALLGRSRALAELGRNSEALTCVMEAYWLRIGGRASAGRSSKKRPGTKAGNGTPRSPATDEATDEAVGAILEQLRSLVQGE